MSLRASRNELDGLHSLAPNLSCLTLCYDPKGQFKSQSRCVKQDLATDDSAGSDDEFESEEGNDEQEDTDGNDESAEYEDSNDESDSMEDEDSEEEDSEDSDEDSEDAAMMGSLAEELMNAVNRGIFAVQLRKWGT